MTSPCEKYFIYIKIKQRAGGGSKRVCFSYHSISLKELCLLLVRLSQRAKPTAE